MSDLTCRTCGSPIVSYDDYVAVPAIPVERLREVVARYNARREDPDLDAPYLSRLITKEHILSEMAYMINKLIAEYEGK